VTEDAELIVSELATNAVRFGGARPISLYLRNFREVLLVEIYDSDSNPPVLSSADGSAESGRGLMLVNALSKEWSYSFPPGGGKIVYCFLAKT
jgi:anti-sigma regulatory factor (Ser/Thr protein kinase)